MLNTIKTVVTSIWDSIKTAISNKITAIKTTIENGFNAAVSFIKNLGSQAFQWGADIINGIVNGIKNCIGKVADAVKGVANKIKSFHPRGHILIGGRGHVNTIAVGIFEDKFEKHGFTPLVFSMGLMYNKENIVNLFREK